MRRSLYGNKPVLILLLGLCVCGISLTKDPVRWYKSSTPDVIDNDLVISDNVVLTKNSDQGSFVRIRAETKDVKVTFTDSKATISGSPTVETLYLEPLNGHTIEFNVHHDVTLQGAKNTKNMLVLVRGSKTQKPGHVIFNVDGGASVILNKIAPDSGAALLYVLLDGSDLCFERSNTKSLDKGARHANIVVANHAQMGYIAGNCPTAQTRGYIKFDPTNAGEGRLALSIHDMGSFLVQPAALAQELDAYSDQIYPASITTQQLGKGLAVLSVSNSSNNDLGSGLIIENNNKTLSTKCMKNEQQTENFGFVVGSNGIISIGSGSYIDYVALTLDQIVDETQLALKKRNPSAFIVEQSLDNHAMPALIALENESAMYFRCGVNNVGIVDHPLVLGEKYPYTIDPLQKSPSIGNMVLDVEGPCVFMGDVTKSSKVEILSLHVDHTGGTISSGVNCKKLFPKRSFAKNNLGYTRYNTGYALINDKVVFSNTQLVHSDENHHVYPKDDIRSEATYVGGEKALEKSSLKRPKMVFVNADLLLHTNSAFTGVDILVPNGLAARSLGYNSLEEKANQALLLASSLENRKLAETALQANNASSFIFFDNGYALDNGNGRHLILGTLNASTEVQDFSVTSKDANLDIVNMGPAASGSAETHSLRLLSGHNDGSINELSESNVKAAAEPAKHTIYLGHASNISIGVLGKALQTTPSPELIVDGDYFAFETRGGTANEPGLSNITGKGGIFVDNHGVFKLGNTSSVTMGAMITKSGSGKVELPEQLVTFAPTIGIADWRPDTKKNYLIGSPDKKISSYILHWQAVLKDPEFTPYNQTQCINGTSCPINESILRGIPTIDGYIETLGIRGSRVGNQAHIRISKNGNVEALVFPKSNDASDMPASVITLDEGAHVGIGSLSRSAGEHSDVPVLGVHGITLILNGNSKVTLNRDVLINTVCRIVQGPANNNKCTARTLRFEASEARTMRITSSGTLDLSTFVGRGDNQANAVEFGGNITVICEPGARIMLGSCTMRFVDQATLLCEAKDTKQQQDMHKKRVVLTGEVATLLFADKATLRIAADACLGIESLPQAQRATHCSVSAHDHAQILVDGILQVGSIEQKSKPVTCDITIDGEEAALTINKHAFLGLGVCPSASNDLHAPMLAHDTRVRLDIKRGFLNHNMLASKSALAINESSIYAISVDGIQGNIRGGGAITLMPSHRVGMLASTLVQEEPLSHSNILGKDLFELLKTPELGANNTRVNIGLDDQDCPAIGYIENGSMQSKSLSKVVCHGSKTTQQNSMITSGAATARVKKSGKSFDIMEVRAIR